MKFFNLSLVIVLLLVGCTSTPNSTPSVSIDNLSEKPQLAGTWITRWADAIGELKLNDSTSGWNGNFAVFDLDGSILDEDTVVVNINGEITLGGEKARYTAVDVVINGRYLGEKLTIKGYWDTDCDFYKTNPSKNLSLAGTAWKILGEDSTIVFKDDDTFAIELSTFGKLFNDSRNADTEGTYTISGTEVTMNYPNGTRVSFSRTGNGGVSIGMQRTASHTVFIEGNYLVSDGVQLQLVTN